MATVSAVVLEHHRKVDGTWNVKIRISHAARDSYINTSHFLTRKQLDKNFKIKDDFILGHLHFELAKYRSAISSMSDINQLSAKVIKERLTEINSGVKGIDFIEFGTELIHQRISEGKEGTAGNFKAIVNSLKDYVGKDSLDINSINYKFLKDWERFLKTDRNITRKTGQVGSRSYQTSALSESGVQVYMSKLRTMFNAARDHFNDEDRGIIRVKHYPFRKYKIAPSPLTAHRNRTVDEIKRIRDVAVLPEKEGKKYYQTIAAVDRKAIISGSRAELARDLFMLSYYLLGMNAADLYELPPMKPDQLRVEYNRSKTRGKRQDRAFMSVLIIPEARPLLEKYAGTLQNRYATKPSLNKAIHKGLAEVSTVSGVKGIDFYDARHSVGSLARNACGFSKDDVAAALNHTQRSVTDIYIAPDWSVVDRVQDALINLLRPQKSFL